MNSYRKPRRRPRVDSLNFATFRWVLIREAYVVAVWRPEFNGPAPVELRRWLCSLTSSVVEERYAQWWRRNRDLPEFNR